MTWSAGRHSKKFSAEVSKEVRKASEDMSFKGTDKVRRSVSRV